MNENRFRYIVNTRIMDKIKSCDSLLTHFVLKYDNQLPIQRVKEIINEECSLMSNANLKGCRVYAECLNFDDSCMITICRLKGKTDYPSQSQIKIQNIIAKRNDTFYGTEIKDHLEQHVNRSLLGVLNSSISRLPSA
jgi:hypothetical protein